MGLDKEDAVIRDTGKKSKHSKKNKMNDLEEATECNDEAPTGVENSFRLSKEVEEKKRKKKRGVSGDIELDSALDEVENGKGCAEVDSDLQKEKDQKKKKKKRKLEFGEDGIEWSENNKEKKDKKKQDVCRVVQKDKNQKKKRKLDHDEDEDALSEDGDITNIKNGEQGSKEKKKKKGKRDNEDKDMKGKKKTQDGKYGRMAEENAGDNDEVVEKKKKKKKEKKKNPGVLDTELATEELGNEVVSEQKDFSDNEAKNGKKVKRKETKSAENDSENPKSKGKTPKKVRFSGNVEVFPASDKSSTRKKEKSEEDELVQGKRFTLKEDEKVREAVQNYIDAHNLGEEGLNKVLNCSSHRELKNCWKEIGAAIPYRPFRAIYYRAHILFERGDTRKWTQEEYEFIKKVQEKHGNNWKLIADELGKHRFHVKDTWRRIKLANLKKGHWSQEEYQTLFDLVNTDLQMKASEEKKSKHGMLRDNICWGAISDKLSTRTNQTCCRKWYKQLTSSMVVEGIWSDVDDYRLIDALFNLDACCVEDVGWDGLLEHRSGDLCRKRWDQMVLHIGQHKLKSFSEQVDILAKRYCPDLVEAREEWDGKPVVD